MNFEILIATVDDKFLKRKISMDSPYVIINQLIHKQESDYKQDNLFSYNEKGLAKSRNRALENATADICLISDDDVVYKKNIKDIVMNVFVENPDVDIITFQVETPEGTPFKKYADKPFKHNYKTIMRVSSVEIAFRRRALVEKKVFFDEKFGLGSEYPTGEEAVFLSDALRKGLKILYVPVAIVVHPKESSGGAFKNNNKLIEAKGAMFYRIFGALAYGISLLFAIRKAKLAQLGVFEFYRIMLDGIRNAKN